MRLSETKRACNARKLPPPPPPSGGWQPLPLARARHTPKTNRHVRRARLGKVSTFPAAFLCLQFQCIQ